jgi:UPF0755 protein
MDDFRRRPVSRPVPPTQGLAPSAPNPTKPSLPQPPLAVTSETLESPVEPLVSQPLQTPTPPFRPRKRNTSRKKRVLWWLFGIFAVVVIAVASIAGWYFYQLTPLDGKDTSVKVVTIKAGTAPKDIADILQKGGVIRSADAFLWYTRFESVQNNLQAGVYRLTPSESTQRIVEHLVSGRVDSFNVTLYPGATLVDTTNTPEDKKYDVTTALKRVGFTDAQIKEGLSADYSDYNTTLFQGRPATADLEGYIYGDTYRVAADATVEDVLRTCFDHLWSVVKENDLVAKYQAQGLNLYQGITLASIIQRESGGDDKSKIAQVFLTRYRTNQALGSDVTYQYITDKLGVARDVNYDSPYNTRRYPGLPPGPISSPGKAALLSVGAPSQTDYVYFLSGDDDVTYFARTYAEHEANIRNHCKIKCQIL